MGTFHACHSKPRMYWIGKPILRRWLLRLHTKIAVSKAALDYVSRHLPGEYLIIPNGVDINHFSLDGPKRKEFIDGKVNILFVGRLEQRKGLGHLINACAKIKQRFPNFRLIVVGPGTVLRFKYERAVTELGLANNVVFTGFVPSSELPSYYRTADIFCAPATGGESFGIVLLEAMACGKPVIATRIEGYVNVLTDREEGLLVPPRNDDSLAHALLTLLEDKHLRQQMGTRGRNKAEKYSWANIARQVMECYINLLKSQK